MEQTNPESHFICGPQPPIVGAMMQIPLTLPRRLTPVGLNLAASLAISFAIGLGLSTLTGCTDMSGIAPKAQLQSAGDLAQRRFSAAPAAASGAWWAAWNDPQLDQLIAQTLSGNPGLKVAQARIEQAQAVAAMAHARTMPELNASASFQRQRFSENQFFPPPIGGNVYWNNEAVLGLSYDLDLWGRQESVAAAAIDRRHASEAELRQIRLELITAVTRAYAQLAAQYELADIAREEQARLTSSLSIARRRLQAGLGAGHEADAIVAAVDRQQARIDSLDSGITLSRHLLAALAGLAPAAGASIHRPQLASVSGLDLPAQLPADLIGRRPDLIAQRWRVEAASASIDAAKTDFYPNFNLLAFVGLQSLSFSNFLDGSSGMHGFGPALSLPIFDGGRRRSQLSLETAGYDAAVETYNGLLVRALQNVADQVEQLQGNRQELTAYRNALGAAQHRLDAARQAQRAGVIPLQAVLDARAAVLSSREALAELEARRRSTYAGLMLALGGGLDSGRDNASQP